ncbi:hypothetical protein L210DRAFT_3570124 [Boletus edulis BED1]|uniref:Uncharacterized protein n=1 Tax=Boletus edulis BED1 TaxID=1328754 RepID=A0AAD4BEZ9_BOLED|nr:hypothetical protein L210DRAFT_3570124 [Boletus edulis BED1]
MVRATGQAVIQLLVCLRQLFPATKICEQLSARQSKAIRNVDVHSTRFFIVRSDKCPTCKRDQASVAYTPNGKTSPDDDVQGQRTGITLLQTRRRAGLY